MGSQRFDFQDRVRDRGVQTIRGAASGNWTGTAVSSYPYGWKELPDWGF